MHTNKISTSPVPLNSPAGTRDTTTGDTYSVTLNYTGTNLTMNMYDVTAGGSCPGASCFSHTWNYVYIPSLVSGTTAYVGFTGATGIASTYPLYINSFVYSVLSPAATPTFSPVAGDYGSTQSVTISASTGPTICYNTTGAPATNGTTRLHQWHSLHRRDLGSIRTDHLRSGWWNRLWRQPGGVVGLPDSIDRFSTDFLGIIGNLSRRPVRYLECGSGRSDLLQHHRIARDQWLDGMHDGYDSIGANHCVVERDSLCDSWWDRLH